MRRHFASSAHNRRQRFIHPLQVLGFASVMGGVLAAMHSSQLPDFGSPQDAHHSGIAFAFQRAWLKADPQDRRLRQLMVEQLLNSHQDALAEKFLRPLLPANGAISDRRVRRAAITLSFRRIWRIPRQSGRRAAERAHLALLQQQILPDLDSDERVDMAQQAAALGHPEIALHFLQGKVMRAHELLVYQLALAASQPRQAADAAFALQPQASSRNQQRHWFLLALRALQGGQLLDELLPAARQHIGALRHDPLTLQELAGLAIAAGDMNAAYAYSQAERHEQTGYSDRTYDLAYLTATATAHLDDAYTLTRQALRVKPRSLRWWRRRAQVATWTERGADALASWRQVVALQPDDAAAWAEIARMAPQLDDHQAMLAWQLHDLRLHGPSHARLQAISTQEEALAQVDPALALLAAAYTRSADLYYKEQAALLAWRAGEPVMAIRLLHELLAAQPDQPHWLADLTYLDYGQGQMQDAWSYLQAAAPQMPATDSDFWSIYADSAHLLGQFPQALQAYDLLIAQGKASVTQIDRCIDLLSHSDPVRAAALAADQLAHHPSLARVLNFMALQSQIRHAADALRIIAALPTSTQQRWAHSSAYHLAHADLAQQAQRPRLAWHDLELSLQENPGQLAARIQLIDLAIAQGRLDRLRQRLRADRAWRGNESALWPAWGRAWLSLHAPARARPYFTRWLTLHPGDLDVMLSLADCLTELGAQDQARHLQRQILSQAGAASLPADTLAYLQLALLDQGGDSADRRAAALRAMARSRWPAVRRVSAQESVADAMSASGNDMVWYGRTRLPAWQATYQALARDDSDAMQALLSRTGSDGADQRSLLTALDRRDERDQSLWQEASSEPEQNDLARQIQELLPEASSLSGMGEEMQIGALLRYGSGIDLTQAMNAHWKIGLIRQQIDAYSLDTTQLAHVPRISTQGAHLDWQSRDDQISAQLLARQDLSHHASAHVEQQVQVDGILQWSSHFDYRQDAPEGAALLALAMKDEIETGASLALGSQWQLSASLRASRYLAQDGPGIGLGHAVDVHLDHALPARQSLSLDWNSDSFAAQAGLVDRQLRYALAAATANATLLPGNYQQSGLFWHLLADDTALVHTWQGIADIGWVYTHPLGTGYELRGGWQGSLIGPDRWQFIYELDKGSTVPGDLVRQINLTYTWFY